MIYGLDLSGVLHRCVEALPSPTEARFVATAACGAHLIPATLRHLPWQGCQVCQTCWPTAECMPYTIERT